VIKLLLYLKYAMLMVVETTLKMMILRTCDYLEKHVMQYYEGEDEVEIFGVIRNTSTVKTKLNGGVLREDLKIELPGQFRKHYSS